MVALSDVKATNDRTGTSLPPDLVAVFSGATTGLGELAMRTFVRHAVRPRVYFIGRDEAQGTRLVEEMTEESPGGQYEFLKADLSLMANVDKVSRQIREKEKAINLLVMSQGTLKLSGDTTEGLLFTTAVTFHSRLRLAHNLLPQIRAASGLRRVVSIFAGTKEGKLYIDDVDMRKKLVPLRESRGHMTSVLTLGMEFLARSAPEVSFIHNFPGAVRTNLIRKESGLMMRAAGVFMDLSMTLRGVYIDHEEAGERYAFLCVSGKYPPRQSGSGENEQGKVAAVPLGDGMEVAVGTNGEKGSGVYTVDDFGESGSKEVIELLTEYRQDGTMDKMWEFFKGEWERITGTMEI